MSEDKFQSFEYFGANFDLLSRFEALSVTRWLQIDQNVTMSMVQHNEIQQPDGTW